MGSEAMVVEFQGGNWNPGTSPTASKVRFEVNGQAARELGLRTGYQALPDETTLQYTRAETESNKFSGQEMRSERSSPDGHAPGER